MNSKRTVVQPRPRTGRSPLQTTALGALCALALQACYGSKFHTKRAPDTDDGSLQANVAMDPRSSSGGSAGTPAQSAGAAGAFSSIVPEQRPSAHDAGLAQSDAGTDIDAATEFDAGSSPELPPRQVVLEGETTTAVQGGGTDFPFYQDNCPEQQVVIGYRGTIANPGVELVSSIQALCGVLSPAEAGTHLSVSEQGLLPERGTPSEMTWVEKCPTDQVVIGVHGRAGDDVDQIGFVCAPVQVDSDGSNAALRLLVAIICTGVCTVAVAVRSSSTRTARPIAMV